MSLRYQIGLLVLAVALIPGSIEMIHLFSNSKEYFVVIDAGSSTTNLLVSVMENESGLLKLAEEELYEKFNPGLLENYDNPQAIKESLEQILKVAEDYVPKGKWSGTQITFRATAGFRLLSDVKQDQILNEVRNVLVASPFKKGNNFVSVLSKSDEGLYAWIAANIILDRLNGNPEDMVATVAIDEDSSHVTFPLTPEYFQQFAFEKRWMPVAGHHVNYYTNRDERLGLGAATVAILKMSTLSTNKRITYSPCVSYMDNGITFTYNRETYIIERDMRYNGAIESDFLDCKHKMWDYMRILNLRMFNSLPNYQIHAINGFFDVLRDAGVVDTTGGITTLDEIYSAGFKVCDKKIVRKNNPFLCLHITYIFVLLSDGYKIQGSSKIYVSNKKNGHRINWATGLAYYNLELQHAQ